MINITGILTLSFVSVCRLLLAEKFLIDCNWEEALDYLKKAFELTAAVKRKKKSACWKGIYRNKES